MKYEACFQFKQKHRIGGGGGGGGDRKRCWFWCDEVHEYER